MTIRTLCLALILAAPLAASAQVVWRCGPDGRSYADTPCAGGREVEVADARSAVDVEQAREVHARDRALAQRLVAERREREREWASRGSGLAGIAPADGVRLRPTETALAKAKPKTTKAKRRPAADAGTSRTAARASPRAPG